MRDITKVWLIQIKAILFEEKLGRGAPWASTFSNLTFGLVFLVKALKRAKSLGKE